MRFLIEAAILLFLLVAAYKVYKEIKNNYVARKPDKHEQRGQKAD